MTPSQKIDAQIASYADWRSPVMAKLRALILEADPQMIEEWKWETGVWMHNGLVCAVSGFKDHVKINFFKGAAMKDPKHLFNGGLDSKKHRSIDFAQNDKIDEAGIKALVKEAVLLNT